MKYNLMIIDDHQIVREGLKLIIETIDHLEVCCEASNGKEAISLLVQNQPDLILLDLMMPEMDGIQFLTALKYDINLKIPVVILTTLLEEDRIKQAISLGAKSNLLKDASRQTLIRTIESALEDETILTKPIRELLLKKDEMKLIHHQDKIQLTEREQYIIKRVISGETSKSIAIELNLSERTVKAYLTAIYSKLGVNSRSEAVAYVLENRII